MLFAPLALMPHPTSLPRICIAMGFPDPAKLLEHARREGTCAMRSRARRMLPVLLDAELMSRSKTRS